MVILYVILGIILIIAIMAFTGYYLEKKQKNVVESENNINIIFDEVNEHKNVNAATNADIPDVLNFNEIEEYENKKEQSNVEPIQFDIENNIDNGNNNDVNVIQFDEPVKLDNEQVQEEVPAVLDLTESSVEITNPVSEEIPAVLDLTDSSISEETVENNDVIEVTEQVQDEPEIPEVVNEPVQEVVSEENNTNQETVENTIETDQTIEEVPAVLDLTSSEIDGTVSESIEIPEVVSEPVQEDVVPVEEPVVLDLTSSEIDGTVSESIEIPEVVNEPVQEDVVPVEEPVKKNKKTKGKSKKNAVSDDEVRQDIVIDSDSITIPDDF